MGIVLRSLTPIHCRIPDVCHIAVYFFSMRPFETEIKSYFYLRPTPSVGSYFSNSGLQPSPSFGGLKFEKSIGERGRRKQTIYLIYR
jgi:hypothetical protein